MITPIRIIYYVLDLIEVILGVRFFLRIAGADAGNSIVRFIYATSDVFLTPFRGIFPRITVESAVLEWSTLFAMAIYALVAYLIVRLIVIATDHEDAEEVASIKRQ